MASILPRVPDRDYGEAMGYAAVILTGGAGRRMGGVDKASLAVAGWPMRERVLAAVSDASPRIVVGPATGLPPDVLVTREDPPGAGPLAAVAAGLALLGSGGLALFGAGGHTIALLAGDLPLLTADAVRQLRRRLAAVGRAVDGVVFLDGTGRRQTLCGVWRVEPLRQALGSLTARRTDGLAGAPMRALLDGLAVAEVTWTASGPPPWFDCDTDEDVRQAEAWLR